MVSPPWKSISSSRCRPTISSPYSSHKPSKSKLTKKRRKWPKPLDSLSPKSQHKRQRELTMELEKLKKRRLESQIKKAQREEEKTTKARERDRAESQDWQRKEEDFHHHQSKLKARIRLGGGRAKPIDMLLASILDDLDDIDIPDYPAYMLFKDLPVEELEELHEEIKLHLGWDRAHVEFWEAVKVVCDWELAVARKRDASSCAEEMGLHSSIEADVTSLLEGKTLRELGEMQEKIELQIRTGAAKVVEFWEGTMNRLKLYKAKACLREIYANRYDGKKPFSPKLVQLIETDNGSYSPKLLQDDKEEEEAIDPKDDAVELDRKREAVLLEQHRKIQKTKLAMRATNDGFELKARKTVGAMEEGDAILDSGAEVHLDLSAYQWQDKYRPRKPKYFNRVHTGYEWNRYNQTHYDHDNPPPKIVQGYKFDIFYPDLIDDKVPTYVFEEDGSNRETCLIRFHAGPPYEDIAFRIVNKEWEKSRKKGFKCSFERGILHLYFNFKRSRYRR